MKYGIFTTKLNSWAASDIDWLPEVGPTTLVFDTKDGALAFLQTFSECFDQNAIVLPMRRIQSKVHLMEQTKNTKKKRMKYEIEVDNRTDNPNLKVSFIQLTNDGDSVKVKIESPREHWVLSNCHTRQTVWECAELKRLREP